uniref:Cytosolic carboxypeptidase 3 n=1 Tax=Nannospalax galili TaxID=1026970 RepID=A0A8C6QV00_NANGA
MSEDSEKEDYSDRTLSDDDESIYTFVQFVSDDIHQCTLLTADSTGDLFFPQTTQILLECQLGRWVPHLREPRDLYGAIDEKVQHIGMFLAVWGIRTLADLLLRRLMV